MIRSITWLVRLLYLPLFLLVGNGVAIYLVAEGYNQGWLVFLILVFIGISFATEKLTPYDRAFNEPQQDQRRDLLHAFMNESLNVIGVDSTCNTIGVFSLSLGCSNVLIFAYDF